MKLINVLFTILVATGLSFSQSFQLIGLGTSGITDTIVVSQVGYTSSGTAHVKNISGVTKSNVYCKRQKIFVVSGNPNYFCWGIQCYDSNTYVSPAINSVSMASGDTNNTFYGYLNDASNSALNDTVRYTVFDGNNPSDSVSWVVVYEFTTGINEVAAPKNVLVNAFPDPSDNASMVNYVLAKDAKSAKINVMNMIGNKVAEFSLDTRETKFNIPTKNLNSGIYFYSLEVDGRVTSTKKLLVNH